MSTAPQLMGGSTAIGLPAFNQGGGFQGNYAPMTPNTGAGGGYFGGGGGVMNMPSMYGQPNSNGQMAGIPGYNAQYANMMQGGASMQSPYGQQGSAYGTGTPYSGYNDTAMSPNQALGQMPSQMAYLQSIAGGQGAGAPISQLPAWQSMVGAQNYNVQQGADSLAEQFNNGGGLFSSAYGNAQGQYQEQMKLGQNAQLTSAQTSAMQQAQQNQLQAAGQLSSQGLGALNTLSGQQYGAGIAQMQNQTQLQQMGMQGALGLMGANDQNLLTGNTLGNSQLSANQNQLTAAYQNWYMSQPQNNPLLSMMYSGATAYPQMTQGTYEPGMLGSLMSGAGGIMGGLGMLGV